MKKTIIAILIPIAVAALIYFTCVFTMFDFNLGHFSAGARAMMSFIWIVISPIAIVVYFDLSEKE